MTDKDMAGKLAAGMRRAKQTATIIAAEPVAKAASNKTAAASYVAPTRPAQAKVTPPSRADGPWNNLHPARVWPD